MSMSETGLSCYPVLGTEHENKKINKVSCPELSGWPNMLKISDKTRCMVFDGWHAHDPVLLVVIPPHLDLILYTIAMI